MPKENHSCYDCENIVNPNQNLDEKEQVIIYMPMTKRYGNLWIKLIAKVLMLLKKLLDEGKNVVFITLGRPTVYATCIYVHKLVLQDGYEAELVAGVTSICAVAAC